MAFSVKLEQFEGPLDVLLGLIEGEKMDISEVSLAGVTDGYLKFLAERPDIPPEELADFLVVATRLLLLKSRLLLPFLHLDDIDEGEGDLESQLKIYKEYLDASKVVRKMISRGRFMFVHEKLPQVEMGFAPPKRLSSDQMASMFRTIIGRLSPIIKSREVTVEKTVSIHEKIEHLRKMISKASSVSFRKMMSSAETKTEIVVSFLALLELIKQRTVIVRQSGQFQDISIEKAEAALTS